MNVPRLRFQGFKGDWLESRINQITSYVDYRGKTPTKVESGVFLVTAKNVRMGYIDYENSKEFIAEDDYGNVMSRGKPVVGDVLITTEAPMGNIASVDRDDIALAQRIIKLRGIQAILQNEFLKYRLQSKQFQEKLTALSSGGTVKGIKGSVLHKIQVLIPAIGEQQKIALFLSKIDQKISLLSKKHEFLVQYKKGVMQKIFSQEIRFKDTVGKNFPEWRIEKISSISSLITKGTTPTSIGCQFTKSGINFIKVESLAANGDFIPNKFAYIDEDCHKKLARSQLEKNDILFSIAGAIGRIAIVKEELLPANTNQALALIRISHEIRLSPQFLFHVLSSESIQKYAVDSTSQLAQANLSLGDLGCIEIPIPSLEEQVKITEFLLFVAKKVEIVNTQLELTKKYKQGLLQQMFI